MKGFYNFLEVGGPIVWLLLITSVIAITIVIFKFWQLFQAQLGPSGNIETSLKKWSTDEKAEAIESLKENAFSADVVKYAMDSLENKKLDEAVLKEELERISMGKLAELRTMLPALDVIGSLSPLVGLLGTVLGMINSFQAMESAGNQADPTVLAGGIWQALLTTALGLGVAIPVITAYNWMDRKIQRSALMINDYVTRVFTIYHSQ